jgi:Chagasin family peptidase inhibitor I42
MQYAGLSILNAGNYIMLSNNTGTKPMLLRSILTSFLLLGSVMMTLAVAPVVDHTITGQNPSREATNTLNLTLHDLGHQQQVKLGTIIKISLPAQFILGYSWVRSGSSEPEIPQIAGSSISNVIRRDGWQNQVFSFSTLKPGKYTLSFFYQHPWVQPHDVLPDKQITFSFLVK